MRIQTLREQGMGAKAIKSAYPKKSWSLNTLKTICRRIDMTGSAVDRKMGSGRPKSARSANNIAKVQELICSQEDAPGTSKSTRQVAAEVGISQQSVGRTAKHDLQLSSFKRMPLQVITDATKHKRLKRCQALLRRLTMQKAKTVFFSPQSASEQPKQSCLVKRKKTWCWSTTPLGPTSQVLVARHGVCRSVFWRQGKASLRAREGEGECRFLCQWSASYAHRGLWKPAAKQIRILARWRTGSFVSHRSRMNRAA